MMFTLEERINAVSELACLIAARKGLDAQYAGVMAKLYYNNDPNSAHRAIEKAIKLVSLNFNCWYP